MDLGLRHKVAIVTGGSRGIGRSICLGLAQEGCNVVLCARGEAQLRPTEAEIAATGVKALGIQADVTMAADIDRVVDEAVKTFGRIDVLVNNAGFGTTGRLHASDPAVQAAMVKLHTLAPMQLTRAVLPAMVAAGRGWIINVSSIAGFTFSPGNVNYGSTKAYITRFSQALDTELAGSGVVVQALCPGFTHTEFHARARMDMQRVPRWAWMTAHQVVEASIRAAERGRPVVVIPGVLYGIITALLRFLPNGVMRWGSRVLKRDV